MYRYVPNESVIKRYGINIPYIVSAHSLNQAPMDIPNSLVGKGGPTSIRPHTRCNDNTNRVTRLIFHSLKSSPPYSPKTKAVRNCAGSFSASELVSVIHYAELYIGVTTGITHIAGNMSKKAIVIGHQYWPLSSFRMNPNGISF